MSTPTHQAASVDASGTARVTMRAVNRRVYGNPDVIRVEEVERPGPGSGEVLVRVLAAGVDRASVHLLTGLPTMARLAFGLSRPTFPTLGQQVAGVVEAVGEGVEGLEVGDRVFGTANGSFAEAAIATPRTLAKTPEGVDDVHAATVGVSGVTAFQAVASHGQVAAGERVLMLGASGAVGSYAVQLAAHLGAEVTGVCSGPKRGFVQALGAQHTVDYVGTPLAEMGGPFDVIIDIAGNHSLRSLSSALTPTGRLVIVGGESGGRLLGGLQRNLMAMVADRFTRRTLGWFFSTTTSSLCAEVAALIDAGALTPPIDRQVGLDGAASCLAAMQDGQLRGHAVITP